MGFAYVWQIKNLKCTVDGTNEPDNRPGGSDCKQNIYRGTNEMVYYN